MQSNPDLPLTCDLQGDIPLTRPHRIGDFTFD